MRVTLSARTLALVILVAIGVVAVAGVLNAARAIIATAVAAAVLAELLTGPVDWLTRWMRRGFAVAIALFGLVGVIGGTVFVVFDDLNAAFTTLQEVAPEAAEDLERSESVGEVARDLRLSERVDAAVESIKASTEERARQAAFRAASYFVTAILTLFLLIYGPRMIDGAVGQVRHPKRRNRFRRVVNSSRSRGRKYLGWTLAQVLISGTIAYVVFRILGLPASAALAAVVGFGSAVPYVGVIAAFVPAILMSGAFEPSTSTIVVALLAATMQGASIATVRHLSRHAMYAGPALTLIAVLLGFDIYGPGGAVFGVAIAVFLIAVVEAVAADRPEDPAPIAPA